MTGSLKNELLKAIQLAQSNDWDGAHQIVQIYSDETACWIHAVLHKIEGDKSNSCYWYARCTGNYEDFDSPTIELTYLQRLVNEMAES